MTITSQPPVPTSTAPLRVGVSSYAFGWAVEHAQPVFDEHALLSFACRHGVPVVQVADNMSLHAWTAERLEQFVSASRSAGISIELGARGLTEAHLERYLELCRRCSARILRFVADAPGYEPSAGRLISLIRNADSALASAGVVLALENHDRWTAIELRRIIEGAGTSRAGVCLDTANSFGAGEGLDVVCRALAPFVVNLHVKDVTIRRLAHQMGFSIEGCALGDGLLPIASTMLSVRRFGQCTTAVLEAWTSPSTNMSETIAKEAFNAELSISRLKVLVAAAGGNDADEDDV